MTPRAAPPGDRSPARRTPAGAEPDTRRATPALEMRPAGRTAERTHLNRDAVVAAALAIADSEGVDAVSMRRVASRLGVGAMTIYGHVRDKDELLGLMWDWVTAEQILAEVPADWRDALTALARSARQCVLRHHWMIGLRPRLGDNVLLHIEQSLQAVGRLDVDDSTKLVMINILDDLVTGCVIREIASGHTGAGHNPASCGLRAKFRSNPELLERVQSGEFPHIAAMLDGGLCIHSERFERGLTWLLDGIEHNLLDAGREPA